MEFVGSSSCSVGELPFQTAVLVLSASSGCCEKWLKNQIPDQISQCFPRLLQHGPTGAKALCTSADWTCFLMQGKNGVETR